MSNWVYVYTADEEEPDCNRCDHICADDDFCGRICGPERCLGGYARTVITYNELEGEG